MPTRFDLSVLSRRCSAKYALALLIAVVAITLVTFTARARFVLPPKAVAPMADVSSPMSATQDSKPSYVERGRFPSYLREALKKLGDRLEKPGKERIVLSGAISRPHLSGVENPFRLILELPNRLRLEEQENGKAKVTVFDGNELRKIGEALKDSDKSEIYSLIYDSADQFFIGQSERPLPRFLGFGFKINNLGLGTSATDTHDVYQLSGLGNIGALGNINRDSNQHHYKLFHFNSKTLLLEGVTYQQSSNGAPVQVAVVLSNWRKVGDQQIPGLITRREDGKPVLLLKINSATINKKENDGIFAVSN